MSDAFRWRWAVALGSLLFGCPLAAQPKAESPKIIPFVPVDLGGAIEFDRHVYPFLAEKCISCHDAEGGVAEAKLDMTTVAHLAKGGKRGPAIKLGKGAESLLVRMSSHALKPIMPPKGKNSLTSRELSILKRWIDEGAKPGAILEPAKSETEFAEPPATLPGTTTSLCVDFSPAGDRLAWGRGSAVLIFDVATRKREATLEGFGDIVQSLRFSPDGKTLAVGAFRAVRLFAVPKSKSASWQLLGELAAGKGRALALDFSPDSQRLAIGGGLPALPGELVVWDVARKTKLLDLQGLHADSILAVAFSADGKKLATAGADKFIRTLEVATGKKLQQFEGHQDHATGVVWLDGDKKLASAGADGTMRTWSNESGEPIRTMPGHPKAIAALRGINAANEAATVAADRVARLVDASDGRHLKSFGDAGEYLHAVAVSKDRKLLAAVGPSGKPHVWQIGDGKALDFK